MKKEKKREEKDTGLSKRTCDVLVWIAEQYTVNLKHLQEVINLHPETNRPISYDGVRTMFWRLRQEGYIEWKRLVRQRPNFVYVTPKTLQELELPFAEYEPISYKRLPNGKSQGTTTIHKDQINAIRIALEKQYGSGLGWVAERWLKFDQEPNADGTFPHRIDGLVYPNRQEIAIEVERTRKGERRLEHIMLELMATYQRIYYFCTQPQTYGLANRVAHDLDPDEKHFQIFDSSRMI